MRLNPLARIPLHLYRYHRAYRPETRQQMIESTNRFLSLVLGPVGRLRRMPRIPRRRVDQGGFSYLPRFRGMRTLCERWWFRMLDLDLFD